MDIVNCCSVHSSTYVYFVYLYLLGFNFILGLNLILYQSHHHSFPHLNTQENNIETKDLLSHNIYSTLDF